jgi:hypothetical protein
VTSPGGFADVGVCRNIIGLNGSATHLRPKYRSLMPVAMSIPKPIW